jgi:hypothetical protein
MTEAIEEIAPIQPSERRDRLRPERRDDRPEEDAAPSAPAVHPHKGNLLDVIA